MKQTHIKQEKGSKLFNHCLVDKKQNYLKRSSNSKVF